MNKLEEMQEEIITLKSDAKANGDLLISISSSLEPIQSGLKFFRDNWGKIKKKLDVNKSGKIELKEWFNPWFLKLILVVFASLMIGSVIDIVLAFLQSGILVDGIMSYGQWDWTGLFDMLNVVGVPFLISLAVKYLIDDYDGRLKAKDKVIFTVRDELATEKQGRLNDQNKHEIAMTQLQGSMDVKNQEIEWLRAYEGKEIPSFLKNTQ